MIGRRCVRIGEPGDIVHRVVYRQAVRAELQCGERGPGDCKRYDRAY